MKYLVHKIRSKCTRFREIMQHTFKKNIIELTNWKIFRYKNI